MRKIENRVSTQVRIDEKLYKKMKAIADIEHRYVNAQLEYFIDQGIKNYEKENGEVIVSDED